MAESVTEVIHGLRVTISAPMRTGGSSHCRPCASAWLIQEIDRLSARLKNPAFLDRAPAEIVEKTRKKLFELESRRAGNG